MRENHYDQLNKILVTEFGSTAWSMNHAGSDRDVSVFFVEPTVRTVHVQLDTILQIVNRSMHKKSAARFICCSREIVI